MDRRDFVKLTASAGLAVALYGCRGDTPLLPDSFSNAIITPKIVLPDAKHRLVHLRQLHPADNTKRPELIKTVQGELYAVLETLIERGLEHVYSEGIIAGAEQYHLGNLVEPTVAVQRLYLEGRLDIRGLESRPTTGLIAERDDLKHRYMNFLAAHGDLTPYLDEPSHPVHDEAVGLVQEALDMKRRVFDERERNAILNVIIHQDPEPVIIYGANHDFSNVLSQVNEQLPSLSFNLTDVTPKSLDDR